MFSIMLINNVESAISSPKIAMS